MRKYKYKKKIEMKKNENLFGCIIVCAFIQINNKNAIVFAHYSNENMQ